MTAVMTSFIMVGMIALVEIVLELCTGHLHRLGVVNGVMVSRRSFEVSAVSVRTTNSTSILGITASWCASARYAKQDAGLR